MKLGIKNYENLINSKKKRPHTNDACGPWKGCVIDRFEDQELLFVRGKIKRSFFAVISFFNFSNFPDLRVCSFSFVNRRIEFGVCIRNICDHRNRVDFKVGFLCISSIYRKFQVLISFKNDFNGVFPGCEPIDSKIKENCAAVNVIITCFIRGRFIS